MKLEGIPKKLVCDFEYIEVDGNPPLPLSFSYLDIDTNERHTYWLQGEDTNRYKDLFKGSLLVGFEIDAELKCMMVLGWTLPKYFLDLRVEYKYEMNGLLSKNEFKKCSLHDVCDFFHIQHLSRAEKVVIINRIKEGLPFDEKWTETIKDMNMGDVDNTFDIYKKMKPSFDVDSALFRGRYMLCVAKMGLRGIPSDGEFASNLKENWENLKLLLIADVNKKFDVYDETTLKKKKLEELIKKKGWSWERTATEQLVTEDDYLDTQISFYPEIKPLVEVMRLMSKLKKMQLNIGKDGRARAYLNPFGTVTGRNAPSTNQFLFNLPRWARSLMKPPEGKAIIYFDYKQQEIGISAYLSGDKNMIRAYESEDSYIFLAKECKEIPPDGTRKEYPEIRSRYKTVMLSLNYGSTVKGLMAKLKLSEKNAGLLLQWYQSYFSGFWTWYQSYVDTCRLTGMAEGRPWQRKGITFDFNVRKLRNYPMQTIGANMLRLAVVLCDIKGINYIATVHDAIVVECLIEDIDKTIKETKECMIEASRKIFSEVDGGEGKFIGVDEKIVKYPDVYVDEDGEEMYRLVKSKLDFLMYGGENESA
jgi:DNA polymerase I